MADDQTLQKDEGAGIQLVTLVGQWPLQHPWVPVCIDSWVLIEGQIGPVIALSDCQADLRQEDLDRLGTRAKLQPVIDQEVKVQTVLKDYPSLLRIRSEDLTWRKILDASIIMGGCCKRMLFIDSDVLVRHPVRMPATNGIHYLREDIPAYRAKWGFAMKERFVRSFNAGLILLDPSLVDLAFLERLTSQYFLPLRNKWWTEQACWSAIAGCTRSRFYFDGSSACTLSGFATRTSSDVSCNRVRFFSSRKKLNGAMLVRQAGHSSVVHLSGLSKHYYESFVNSDQSSQSNDEAVELVVRPDPLPGVFFRIVLGSRLLILNLLDTVRAWRHLLLIKS